MKRVLWLVVFALATAAPCLAQSETAMLTGRVTDQTGAVLIGATVTVTSQATGAERVTVTNDAGRYVVPGLIPGTYRIVVTLDGFAQVVKTGVELRVQDNVAENFELRVGSLSESTTVEASTVRVASSPAVATSIDPAFVSRIPLNGRTIQSLLALAPGMTISQTNDVGQVSSNGMRTTMNAFYIDGVSANVGVSFSYATPGYTGSGVGAFSTLGTTNNLVSVDALQEFAVQTSTFSAEYGRQPGAQVSMTTRSGTNEFHGSAFGYFRDDSMDAVDWFVKRDNLKRPESSSRNAGGTLGGPIVRNRTFFFGSYEFMGLQLPNTITSEVVANYLRAQAHPALKPYVDASPLPTGPDNTTTGKALFTASYSDPSRLHASSVRVDHVFSQRFNAFARYNVSPNWGITHPATYFRNEVWNRTQTLTGGTTMVLSPTMTNVVRANWSDNRGRNEFLDTDFEGASSLPDSARQVAGIDPTVSRALINFLNGAGGAWFGFMGNNRSRQVNVTDTLTLARQNHTFRFGVDYRNFSTTSAPAYNDLNVGFTTPASMISGVASLVILQLYGPSKYSYNNFSAFAQDAWRVNDRLTLDYGLRWDLNPPPTITPGPMLVNGAPDFRTATLGERGQEPYDTQWANLAPRVGGAYRFGNVAGWETVLRGGYGVFYDIGAGAPTPLIAQFPYTNAQILLNQQFPLPVLTLPEASTTPPYPATSYLARYVDYVTPRVHQWSATVEQALGRQQRLTVNVVGNAGRRLLRRSTTSNRSFNNPLFAPTATFYNTTNTETEGDRSDHWAVQTQFFHRSRSLQAMANYTWSRTRDTNASDVSEAVMLDQGYIGWLEPDVEYGISALDRPHTFSAAVTYDVPSAGEPGGVLNAITRGWSVDAMVQAQSGRPININYLWTLAATNQSYSMRPDLTGQPIWTDAPSEPGGRRLNAAAFTYLPNPAERPGSMPRNSVRGPGYWQADVSFGRQVTLPGNIRLRAKAEIFNVFNVANFRNPSPILGRLSATGVWTPQATFGQTTQMLNRSGVTFQSGNDNVHPNFALGGPRAVQLSVRVTF